MTCIHTQYKHAMSALKISQITQKDSSQTSFMDIYFEYMLLSIPESKRQHYYEAIIGSLLTDATEKNTWITTLECYFRNNQSIVNTSNELFIHRNTLLFRLNRIGQLTGFYPQQFTGAINLYCAIMMWKLHLSNDGELLN